MSTTGEGSLTEMTIDVASFTNHESYSFPDNDITIIELAQEVDLTTYTPACMAKTSDTTTFDGKNAWVYGEITESKVATCYLLIMLISNLECSARILLLRTVLGWGALSYGTGEYPDVLYELEVGVVTNDVCSSAYTGITDGMICAGGVEGQDSCQVSRGCGGGVDYKMF